jgi:hypothetical protein
MVAVLVELAHGCAFGFGARRVASVQRVTGWLFYWREPQAAEASRHPWLEPMEIPRPTRGRGDATGAAAFTRPAAAPARATVRLTCGRSYAPAPWLIALLLLPPQTTCMMIANTTGENEMVGGEDDDAYCCGRARRDRSLCNLWTGNAAG